MTNDVATCRPDDSVRVAAKLMWERDCGCVPVVDGERRVEGMITDRDICMAAYFQGKALDDIPVRRVMSGEAFCCHAGDSAGDAESLMQRKRVRRLPVIDDEGHLEGILSLNDLALQAMKGKSAAPAGKNGRVSLEEVGATLKAVSEHRPHALAVAARHEA